MAGTFIFLPPEGGGSSSDYWQDAVANFAALPVAGDTTGEVKMTLDTGELYYWNSSAWVLVPSGAITANAISDSNSVDLTVTSGDLSAAVRISANAADVNYIAGELSIQSSSSVGLRAQIANSLIRGLLSSANAYIGYNNSTGVFTFDPALLVLLAGRATGQTINGGTAASENLTLSSTSHGTKGFITLSDITQLPRRTTVELNAVGSPVGGMIAYDTTVDRPKVYIAGATNAWVDIAGWGAP